MTINLRELATSMNDFVFSTKIPSTGEIVNGKPYTIRDEFKMAQIQNSVDRKGILNIIFDLVKDKYYTLTTKQIENLTLTDIQWLLASLKINSDEHEIPIIVTCSSCGQKFDYKLNLAEIKLDKTEFTKTIKFQSDKLPKPLSMEFKTASFVELIKSYNNATDSFVSTDDMTSSILDCIGSIAYGDEMGKVSDFQRDDLVFFIEHIPKKFFPEIKAFINNPPTLVYERKPKCSHCGKDNVIGLEDFFSLLF
jgi:hypothetical protein